MAKLILVLGFIGILLQIHGNTRIYKNIIENASNNTNTVLVGARIPLRISILTVIRIYSNTNTNANTKFDRTSNNDTNAIPY